MTYCVASATLCPVASPKPKQGGKVMATRMASNSGADASSLISDLETVLAQLKDAQGKGAVERRLAGFLNNAGKYLVDNLSVIVERSGQSEDFLTTLSESLTKVGSAISPTASLTWTKEQVSESMDKLEAMLILNPQLNLLSDEQVTQVEALKVGFKELRTSGGTGVRGERTEQPVIEGKTERVRVSKVDDDSEIANQAGNKANSPSNIRYSVVKYLQGAGIEVNDALSKEITAGIKAVVDGDSSEVIISGALKVAAV